MTALLPTRTVEKPWGRDVLPAPFTAPAGARIGEIWFEPPAVLPQLLAKYIFTSERLSVQVHPSDAQALAAGLGRQGKEECWLVIDAAPGAVLGIGFDREIGAEAMRDAALDGSIPALLTWHPVQAGDFFVIPANTVHAIGAGIGLIEVQQNSDVTFRLHDYGRPRELHLEQGLHVALGQPYDTALRARAPDGTSVALVDGPLFRLDQTCGAPGPAVLARHAGRPVLVLPRTGTVRVGTADVPAGSAAVALTIGEVDVPGSATCLIASSLT